MIEPKRLGLKWLSSHESDFIGRDDVLTAVNGPSFGNLLLKERWFDRIGPDQDLLGCGFDPKQKR